jgi:CRP-like cAMP-binding protein
MHSFRRGEVAFHPGDPAGPLHVICVGAVKVTAPTTTGDEAVLAPYGAGVCFGEIAALDGEPRSATVTALEPTETLALPLADLAAHVRMYPELAPQVIGSSPRGRSARAFGWGRLTSTTWIRAALAG